MADLATDFRSFVITPGGPIRALIGEKFFWNRSNDGASYPYVRATTVTDPSIHYQNKKKGSRLGRATIQMDIFDDNEPRLVNVVNTMIDNLDGYRGSLGEFRVVILVKNVPNSFDEIQKAYRRILEVEVSYARS
jgi:hypothetical protein